MKKKIVIIGAGIAGLSAGIYAQLHGFESEIYESGATIGGECTGWERKGFHIDGCIHWLTGTKEGTVFNRIWHEVGALSPSIPVHYLDTFATVEKEGKTISLFTDIEKFRAHLKESCPEDTDEIEKLCEYIKVFYRDVVPEKPIDMMNPIELIQMIKAMKAPMKVMQELALPLPEYLKRFKSTALRAALSCLLESYSAYIIPYTLATLMTGDGGRPSGGSREMAFRIARRYEDLGGKIYLNKEVEEIIIEKGIAKGILLKNSTKVYGDYIVPCCDIHVTINKLLKNKYEDKQITLRDREPHNYPLTSSVYISFGVDADLSDYPADFYFQTEPYSFEEQILTDLSFKHYCYEKSFAPEGKSTLIVYLEADYEWWKAKRSNLEYYKSAKKELALTIQKRIISRFPELEGKMSLLDVATPVTYERYCGAYRGAWMAYATTQNGKRLMHNGKIKGIKKLYMAGQWLMPPGGLPGAAITGKWAIQRISKAAKIKW